MTSLSLIGCPQSEPIWIQIGSITGPRPDGGQYTELGLDGLPRPVQTFTTPTTSPRPDGGTYTELGLDGLARPYQTFLPKVGARGIAGRTTLSITPQSSTIYGRRYSIIPNITLGIRPMGATITVAHTSNRQGRTTLSFGVQATMRYRRQGNEYSYSGGTTITISTSGAVRVRTRRSIVGNVTLSVTPRATVQYTPAPVRNHHIAGRVTTTLQPVATMAYLAGGLDYAISGSNLIQFEVLGRVSVVRQTTYRMHGSVTLTLRPQGTITKQSGPPQSYYIQASTTLSLTPRATLAYNLGTFEHFGIAGHVTLSAIPRGTVTVRRAPSITPLTKFRRGRRRFIRLFDYR